LKKNKKLFSKNVNETNEQVKEKDNKFDFKFVPQQNNSASMMGIKASPRLSMKDPSKTFNFTVQTKQSSNSLINLNNNSSFSTNNFSDKSSDNSFFGEEVRNSAPQKLDFSNDLFSFQYHDDNKKNPFSQLTDIWNGESSKSAVKSSFFRDTN